MPSVREQFKTYHDFASADMKDIFGDRLKEAIKYEMSTPETGIFYNDGKGKFTFEPLPWDAQIAPVRGISATHLDGDGQIDLVLAQNFYDNQRETGRMNGGLSLAILRKPDGSFQPLAPSISGLSITGNARSLTATDLNKDGKPDLCFYHNGEKPRFFINRAPGTFIQIELKGDKGNPQGIGSRLNFLYADGTTSTSEVNAGEGYLSQAPATIHHCAPSGKYLKSIEVSWADGSKSTYEMNHNEASVLIEK